MAYKRFLRYRILRAFDYGSNQEHRVFELVKEGVAVEEDNDHNAMFDIIEQSFRPDPGHVVEIEFPASYAYTMYVKDKRGVHRTGPIYETKSVH